MTSKIVGQLTKEENFGEWYSDLIEIPYFKNKRFKIIFTEAENPEFLLLADTCLGNFLRLTNENQKEDSAKIIENYNQNLIFEYTPKLDLKTVDKIWEYVYPTDIIITQNENGDIFVLIECECEWEEEHGLQLVFKNGLTLTRISYIDGGVEDL